MTNDKPLTMVVKDGDNVVLTMTHWPDFLSADDFIEFSTAVMLTLSQMANKPLAMEAQND